MKRTIYQQLLNHLSKKEFTILTGARQIGKSTLMKQLSQNCNEHGIPTISLNLENKIILADLNESPLNLLNYFEIADQKTVVFIDEIQYLNDPSNFLKLLYDDYQENIKIVATGSSAFYLDDKFKDSLAGRKKIFELHTFSFQEYLSLSNKENLWLEVQRISKSTKAKTSSIESIKTEWFKYMVYGGYPAVILENDLQEKIEKLKEIRDSFVKRDILESGVKNETAFYNLFRLLAQQTGSLVNVNELSSTLRINQETVNNYLHIMQKCFHIKLLQPFYQNLRKELTKMPKVFLLDTGLRNCLLNNFEQPNLRLDKGELWENVCFRVLSDIKGSNAIKYWRTADGNEVDFIITDDIRKTAAEAKYNQALVKQSKYKKFKEAYPEITLHFLWAEPFDERLFSRFEQIEN